VCGSTKRHTRRDGEPVGHARAQRDREAVSQRIGHAEVVS
jgi:hypothetical protein